MAACTSQTAPADSAPPAGDAAAPSGTAIPESGAIFGSQASALAAGPGQRAILQQVSAKGSVTIAVESWPEGYSQLGVAVQCSGDGEWVSSIGEDSFAQASASCSLNAGAAYLVEAGNSKASRSVSVEAKDEASLWVTVFAATQ